ncbi:phospholipase D family protein [Aquincola sp. S2]|uniref:Phospholipase D family protein n=1 Tax=Pseudaquabacterium terrae TaxID=2732868 RepID=A0ABX2EAY8_9BURK|nr:phospholipase D family protein [Aquabacterium terrae]NRF66276.1 phospholipase D family protein [Aquabacterium terrae]
MTNRLSMLALVVMLGLGGCAGLPSGVQRAPSQARHDVADTSLAQIAAQSTPEAQQALSGFRLLPDGAQALEARIALAQRAAKSLDLQYYQLAHDRSGWQLLRALRDAAARGVRVRLLVDDLYAAGQDAMLAGLAALPNVEVRMFNPLPVRDAGFATRIVLSLHQFARINRRMHNKLFVADNRIAITGGRNIADEYFGRADAVNFIDLDTLATGPAVAELSAAFDGYWNSEHVYPIAALQAAGFDPAAATQAFSSAADAVVFDPALATTDALGRSGVAQQLAEGRLALLFAPAQVLADAPAKADERGPGADGAVAHRHAELVSTAREEVLIASPYVVPAASSVTAIKAALLNKVHYKLITNSISTTDEPLVHAGYAKHRMALLKMGVKLYELMPLAQRAAARDDAAPRGSASVGRLHAKLAVVDRRFLFIGSMNLDHRSARSNTEAGLVIDSPALAAEVAGLLQRDRLPESYRLRLADDGRIEWISQHAGAEVVHRDEPHLTVAQSLKQWLGQQLVDEELL